MAYPGMKLEEAIEIVTALVNHGTEILSTPEIYALNLGVEAFKRIHSYRTEGFIRLRYPIPLPGETIE